MFVSTCKNNYFKKKQVRALHTVYSEECPERLTMPKLIKT
jgi:hypothetical protein